MSGWLQGWDQNCGAVSSESGEFPACVVSGKGRAGSWAAQGRAGQVLDPGLGCRWEAGQRESSTAPAALPWHIQMGRNWHLLFPPCLSIPSKSVTKAASQSAGWHVCQCIPFSPFPSPFPSFSLSFPFLCSLCLNQPSHETLFSAFLF